MQLGSSESAWGDPGLRLAHQQVENHHNGRPHLEASSFNLFGMDKLLKQPTRLDDFALATPAFVVTFLGSPARALDGRNGSGEEN